MTGCGCSERCRLSPDDERHGTYTGSHNQRCVCDPCTDAHHAYQEAARRAKGIPARRGRKPTGRTCGKRATYRAGCHCEDCRRAEANYQCLRRRAKRREAGVVERTLDWAIDVRMGRAA